MPVRIAYRMCPLEHIARHARRDSAIWWLVLSLEHFHIVTGCIPLAMPLGEAYFYPGDPLENPGHNRGGLVDSVTGIPGM